MLCLSFVPTVKLLEARCQHTDRKNDGGDLHHGV